MVYTPVKGYWKANASESIPDMASLASAGFPTSGDPRKGTQPTIVGPAWYYLMDQLRLSLIAAAGQEVTTPPDPGQFLDAMRTWKWALDGKMPGKVLEVAAIATSLLANNAVTAEKIANGAVETEKIKDAAVTLAKMAANSVDNSKIKDATIAFAKFASTAIATSAQAADKSNAETIVTPARMHEVINSYLMPAGTIVSYAGASVPTGWLLCNGANVSRTTYANLFNAIGTRWGAGNGSTTFALPDSDGRVLQGATDASKVGQYLEAGLPNIIGYLEGRRMSQYGSHMFSNVGGSFYYQQDTTANDRAEITMHDVAAARDNYYFSASASNSAYSGSSVQPAALQTLIIIKV